MIYVQDIRDFLYGGRHGIYDLSGRSQGCDFEGNGNERNDLNSRPEM